MTAEAKAKAKTKTTARSRVASGANTPRDIEVIERALARNAPAQDEPDVIAARGASIRLRLEEEADAAAAADSHVDFPRLLSLVGAQVLRHHRHEFGVLAMSGSARPSRGASPGIAFP